MLSFQSHNTHAMCVDMYEVDFPIIPRPQVIIRSYQLTSKGNHLIEKYIVPYSG